jgi:hypothetical protein
MTPRLKSSKTWTSLPKEYLTKIQEVFTAGFKAQAKRGQFLADGRIYATELLVRIGYLENGHLAQANFEISLEYNPQKDNVLDLTYLAIDAAASLMEGHFEGGDPANYPQQWQAEKLDKHEIFYRYSSTNTQLENQADQLLGKSQDHLVQGDTDDDDETLDYAKGILGLDVPPRGKKH